jgi:alpha-N-arabinofuranosidase
VHLDPRRAASVQIAVTGMSPTRVSGRVLTAAELDARNSFDRPNALAPIAFIGATLRGQTIRLALPAKSVVVLSVR